MTIDLGRRDLSATVDSSVDDDGGVGIDPCPRRWGVPIPLPGMVNTARYESHPSMSGDLLRVCYSLIDAAVKSSDDIWCATRSSPSDPFGAPVNQTNMNSAKLEDHATLSADGTEIFFTSNRNTGSHLFRATLMPGTDQFGAATLVAELNETGIDVSGPELSKDGLNLFFAAKRPGGTGTLDIWVSRRASATAAFEPPQLVRGLSTAQVDGEPGLCADLSFGVICHEVRGDAGVIGRELLGAARVQNGYETPTLLDVLLPIGVQPCGPTILSNGWLMMHYSTSAAADDIFIAPPIP